MALQTKQRIASERGFTPRTVDNWVASKLLEPPMKLGKSQQAHVRWTDEQVAKLDANLAALSGPAPAATPSPVLVPAPSPLKPPVKRSAKARAKSNPR